MTTFDRYALVFLLAFALMSSVYGVKNYYREAEVAVRIEELTLKNFALIEDKDCWRKKAQEASVGIRKRRC